MATLINNAGVQHYANKMVLAENRKVGSKSLPTALNDIDNLIDEMKTQFDEEYGTALDMKLENGENVFSVGTGIDINKKDEVENGFTDIELSGNSLVNLVSSEIKSMTSTRTSGWHQDRSYKYSDMIKPNTTYTIVCQVLNNTLSTPFGMGGSTKTYNQLNFNTFKNFAPKETGIKINVVQSYDEWDKTQALILFPQFGNRGEGEGLFEIGETIKYRFMIFEGDYSNNPPIDFFNGLKSVGEKEDGNHNINLTSLPCKPNLLASGVTIPSTTNFAKLNATMDMSLIKDETLPNGQCFKFKIIDCGTNSQSGIYCHPEKKLTVGKQYTWSAYIKCSHEKQMLVGSEQGGNTRINVNKTWTRFSQTFTVPSSLTHARWAFVMYLQSPENGQEVYIHSLKIEEGELSNWCPNKEELDSISYKHNKKEISLNEPLRGLPNGIRDTIEKINGEWKIVRRCVEVTLNGSETSWNRNTDFNGTEVLFFYINTKHNTSLPEGATKSNGNRVYIQCDSFPCYALKDRVNNKNNNIEAIIYSDTANPLIQFHINKSKLASEDLTGFKQWLSQNPTKVVYELVTPIIEDISPVTLQCWKNGTISIDEVLPVESTHTVALNKGAQIQRNIEELTELRNRVKNLEETYEQLILDQTYQLALLNNSIKLDNK